MFLSDRTQCVRVSTSLSSYRPVISGVPQGSVLGPLLFNVYINDITDSFSDDITAKLFADDIKLYTLVTTSISLQNFQIHLDHIHAWSIILWQLSISSSKCSSFELGKRDLCHPFHISFESLIYNKSTSDLGISIDRDLNFRNTSIQ